MTGALIVILLVITILVALFGTTFGKRLRLRAKGTADEAIEKDASTPEGAKAYYNTAISQKQDDYQKANSMYTQMLGKIQTYEGQLRILKKDKMQAGININACIDKGDDEGAKVYLKNQQEISDKEQIIEGALKELKENAALQKETVHNIFEELNNLKTEKDNAILTLETAQVTESLQATVSIREEDKMLEKVREGVRKKKEKADGTKIAYENSAEVQKKQLDKKMKEDEINRKLQELKTARK